MKSARHQLVLLGLICQGLSWDDYWLPLLNILLWIFCLRRPGLNLRLGPLAESGLLIGGSFASFGLGKLFQHNIHFFIGHGLALLQLARLMRPLARSEKFFSVLIAFFHIGVACTFVFDLRFMLILAAAIVLIPKAFCELAAERFGEDHLHSPWRSPTHWAAYGVIILTTIVIFLVFPRVFLGAQFAPRRSSASDFESMLDSVMDSTRGALGQSSKVLMQIEGDNLGYLRCLSLINFDGIQWSAPKRIPKKTLLFVSSLQPKQHLVRRVRVKNAALLGQILPIDGQVVNLSGNFFWRPYQNIHGGIICESMWNTANNTYEYWINRRPMPEPFRGQLLLYTNHPPASARLRAWLDQALAGENEPLKQARKLEAYFRTNFVYELGAPKLDRLNPTEDFLFNQKKGHCERFASTMTLLLRLLGIPSRVVIGYVPTSRNFFTGGYNIRFKDAHAWTEAYFPQIGWIQLDATPRATTGAERWNIVDFVENLDSAWSSFVVNFDAPMQNQLFTGAIQTSVNIARYVRQHLYLVLSVLILSGVVWIWRCRRKGEIPADESDAAREKIRVLAGHYYGQMLQALEHRGLRRQLPQTPLEFLQANKVRVPWIAAEIEMITRWFCATRYGLRSLSKTQQTEIEQALERIKRQEPSGG